MDGSRAQQRVRRFGAKGAGTRAAGCSVGGPSAHKHPLWLHGSVTQRHLQTIFTAWCFDGGTASITMLHTAGASTQLRCPP